MKKLYATAGIVSGAITVGLGSLLLILRQQEAPKSNDEAGLSEEQEYPTYQSACMAKLPGGSEIKNLVATTPSGRTIYLSPCTDGALGRGANRNPGPDLPGDYGPGQMDYEIGLVNPYDGGPNLFNGSDVDSSVPGLDLWGPYYDAGFYAHFTQLTGWLVVPPNPSDGITRNNLWPGLSVQTAGPPHGYGSSGSINGGTNVLQPIVTYVQGINPPWGVALVWCCDASGVGISAPGVPRANPGDIVSFEIMVDSTYPCPNNGLGCHYLMGANVDSVPNFNFGNHWISIHLDPCEGPIYTANYALEQNSGGISCPSSMPGGDASVFHVETLYEAADQNISPPGVTSLPLVAPFPPPFNSGLTPSPWKTGYGYPVVGALSSTQNVTAPGTNLDITRSVGICAPFAWDCPSPCDAGAIGNDWFVSWE